MKKFCFLLFLAFGLFSSNGYLHAQWADSSLFKQEIQKIGQISLIKFSEDGSKIFTYSDDKYFRIWNTKSGFLMKESYLDYPFISDVCVHKNERYIALAVNQYVDYMNPWNPTNNPIAVIYDFMADSVVATFKAGINNIKEGITGYRLYIQKVRFIEDKNQIISSTLNISSDNMANAYFSGFFEVFDIPSGKWLFSNDTYIAKNIIISNFRKDPVLIGYREDIIMPYKFYYYYGCEVFNLSSYSKIELNFDTKIGKPYCSGDCSSDDNFLAVSTDQNNIAIFDFNNFTYFKSFNNGNPSEYLFPASIVFLNNSKDFYTSSRVEVENAQIISTKYSIRRWNVNREGILDSIDFTDDNGTWIIDLSSDSKYLAAGSDSGHIRLFKIDEIFSVEDGKYRDKTYISISPNPATDFIEISVGAQGTVPNIRIFNVFGEIVKNPTPILPEGEVIRIDVSGLPSGVYFVRVGEKVGKFLKIMN